MRREKAEYHQAILPEHRGNPLIEALKPKLGINELLEQFSNYPVLDEHIRQHPDPLVREEYTIRLKQLRQPFLIYYECFRAIETAIKDGYSTKIPLAQLLLSIFTIQLMPDLRLNREQVILSLKQKTSH
ncbi:hypothetical protein [Enterobacter roggenkampii]|jgi:hypothetical protein|uniref:hypothetical protein n=1 Tax=Enterobacter roggenkampii TaxID=1812935 RepID=UPI00389096A1